MPNVSRHFRFRTSLIMCQLAYFVRICWNYITNVEERQDLLFSLLDSSEFSYTESGQILGEINEICDFRQEGHGSVEFFTVFVLFCFVS